MFYANRGMLTETLIENTIQWYLLQQRAWFTKRYVPIKILNSYKNKEISGKIVNHAGVDYYGVYNGKHIEFEVKETNNDVFLFSNLKKHQYYQLQVVFQHKGIAFLLIHFLNQEKIWFLPFENLIKIKKMKIKQLDFNEIKKYAHPLEIIYPGIIDFLFYI